MWKSFIFLGALAILCCCDSNRLGKSAKATETPHNGDGWVSSGGELIGDSHNPWWVSNTKEINYCIEVDETSISIRKEDAPLYVESAIKFWKKEFSLQQEMLSRFSKNKKLSQLKLATQEFKNVPCTEPVQLKIQLGYGTFSGDQIKFLGDPTTFVERTVRTEYNRTELKAEGFMVIASDLGPNRFKPKDGSVPEGIYGKDGELFRTILIHGFGHIFGIADEGPEQTLMSEKYPENIVLVESAYLDIMARFSNGELGLADIAELVADPEITTRVLRGLVNRHPSLILKQNKQAILEELERDSHTDEATGKPTTRARKMMGSILRRTLQDWLGHFPPNHFVVPSDDVYYSNDQIGEKTVNWFSENSLWAEKGTGQLEFSTHDWNSVVVYREKLFTRDRARDTLGRFENTRFEVSEDARDILVTLVLPTTQQVFKGTGGILGSVLKSPLIRLRGTANFIPEGRAGKIPVYLEMAPGSHGIRILAQMDGRLEEILGIQKFLDPRQPE